MFVPFAVSVVTSMCHLKPSIVQNISVISRTKRELI